MPRKSKRDLAEEVMTEQFPEKNPREPQPVPGHPNFTMRADRRGLVVEPVGEGSMLDRIYRLKSIDGERL
jgi:hypothetical protein